MGFFQNLSSPRTNQLTLFLPIESTPRELDYKLNLARLFCKEGYRVLIGNPPFIRDELKYKNYHGVFLEKGMNPDSGYYQGLIDKNIVVYCLSDEGAAHPAYSVTYPPAVEALKKAETIFLWGTFQKNDLVSRNSDETLVGKYEVLGYPGFDLCLPPYRNYHAALRPQSIGAEYILVNTNFASCNGFSLEEVLKACTAMSPETRTFIINSYQREQKAFDLFKKNLEQIIQKFPRERFLIRPHPVERREIYDTMASVFKNVVVSRRGNANQAISGAKLVIHHDCTTALQSYLGDIPVVSLATIGTETPHAAWALEFGAKPQTLEEAVENVAQVLKNKKFNKELTKKIHNSAALVLSQLFCNVGQSTQDIFRVMRDRARELEKSVKPSVLRDSRSYVQKIKVFVRQFLPLHYKVPLISRVPLEKFTKGDLVRRLNLLNQMDRRTACYKIKKVFPNAYMLEEKK
jgi:surface carbohydrate biosynthesis protein